MKEKTSPGGAISGDEHAVSHEPLPTNWDYAIQRFAKSSFAYAALGAAISRGSMRPANIRNWRNSRYA